MGYNKEELFELALQASEKRGFHFVEDVISELPCSKTTFYTYFPDESNELNAIKANINKNKVDTKRQLRRDLMAEGATGMISVYKLLATDEERRALSMQSIEHSGSMKIENTPLTPEALDKIMNQDETRKDEKE